MSLMPIQYVVVDPNKAHVVVSMGKGRKVFHPSQEGSSSSYFYVPLLMKRIIVSLENVKHEINDVILHDNKVAPFRCDITCWFKITNPELAAEKLDVDENGNIMTSIKETLDAQVQGIARNAAMQQEILDLMRDRLSFGELVRTTVNGDLDEWGVQLVKLEIIDFADTGESRVIADYEARREAEINSQTRITVATENKKAEVKEAEARNEAEQAKIDTEQKIEMRQIEQEETVGIRNENARLAVAEQKEKANELEVKAERTRTVGQANYIAEAAEIEADGKAKAAIKESNGKAEGVKLEAEAAAVSTEKKGKAEADIIAAKGKAEAEALEKKADAQKKFTDVSKDIEMAQIAANIEITKFKAMAEALQSADINIVSDDINFMGFGAKEGAGIGALAKALETTSGTNLQQLVSAVADKIEGKQE